LKFCPKCGGIMVPLKDKEEGKVYLVCRNCGYRVEASPEDLKRYRGREGVSEEAKVLTTKTLARPLVRRNRKEELEQAKEEYYEFVLEQMGEYGE